jgi:hypothetical protein
LLERFLRPLRSQEDVVKRHRSRSPLAARFAFAFAFAFAGTMAVPGCEPAAAHAQDAAPPDTASTAPQAAGATQTSLPSAPAGPPLPPAPPAIAAAPPPYPYPYRYPYPWAPPPQALPARLDYVDGAEVPRGYHVETGIRTGLVIAGAVMLGVGYGIAAGVAASTEGDGRADSAYIPIAGPFILAGRLDYDAGGGLGLMAVGVPLILNGLVQTAGTVLLVAGLGSSRSWLQRNDIAAHDTTLHMRVGLPSVRGAERDGAQSATLLSPSAGTATPAAASGLSLLGRF